MIHQFSVFAEKRKNNDKATTRRGQPKLYRLVAFDDGYIAIALYDYLILALS